MHIPTVEAVVAWRRRAVAYAGSSRRGSSGVAWRRRVVAYARSSLSGGVSFCSQLSNVLSLSGGVHRFCKNVFCLLTAQARHRHADRSAISVAEHLPRDTG